ncbi:MAG: formate--tetrahydrofolate ligase, partial [Pseudonocardiaceae bacterium]
MAFPSDLDIARGASLRSLVDVAAEMGLGRHLLEPYGEHVVKIKTAAIGELAQAPTAKYVVVTAVTPTPLGEGKTTTTVGLGQGFAHIGKRATVAIRQPSMGPTFGIKGGAAGGGYSQVVPMETLNLHLTGDMHAVTAAHNLLAAMIDNRLQQRDGVALDPHSITWNRVLDVNDRALRNIVIGLGSRTDGTPRQSGFDITAASEVMAVLALSTSLQDMRARLGRIVVGQTREGQPVTAEDLQAAGAMTVIMREAIKPNLLQTLEGTPVLVHAGPFGNIAHGNSSVIADLIGIHGGDYLVTEAGFGADMGAERFFNIKCRASGLRPDAAVLVATVRALKTHSGRFKVAAGRPLPEEMLAENPDDVYAGAANLRKQIENVRIHGVSPVVAINAFPTDHPSEHRVIREVAESLGARCALCTHFAEGGKGAVELATAVAEAAQEQSHFAYLYPHDATLREKILTVALRVYGAQAVDYDYKASRQLESYERNGFGKLPVCIAKTHLSISSDPALKGAPSGWVLPVREARASVGAGFIYLICGDMRTM